MPHHSVGDMLMMFLGPEIIDDGLNPVLLSVATRGHWVQSHILHIPDQYGFFSPGPPRRQVFEASRLVVVTICLSFITFSGLFTVFVLRITGKSILPVFMILLAWEMGFVAWVWYEMCNSNTREPGYVWGDRKIRKD